MKKKFEYFLNARSFGYAIRTGLISAFAMRLIDKTSGKFLGLQLLFPSVSDLQLLFPSASERCFPIFKTVGFLRPLRGTSEQVEFISARTGSKKL